MITKFKSITLPTGEELTYWRSDGGTCTVDVKFQKDGPVVASATSGTAEDALASLSTRFQMLGIELDNLSRKT